LSPNQCEVIYINSISVDENASPYARLDRITPLWSDKARKISGLEVERTAIQTVFILKSAAQPYGRLYVIFTPALRAVGSLRPIIQLEMTARGRPENETLDGAFWEEYYSRPRSAWEREIPNRINNLMKLPDNWDGYRSPPPRDDARDDVGAFALTVMKQLMQPETPVPQVVPSAGGGLQLEWHEKEIDLEVNFTAPYECDLWVEDYRTGICVSKLLTNEFSDLKEAIELLTAR
jgi:hypothetical protein